MIKVMNGAYEKLPTVYVNSSWSLGFGLGFVVLVFSLGLFVFFSIGLSSCLVFGSCVSSASLCLFWSVLSVFPSVYSTLLLSRVFCWSCFAFVFVFDFRNIRTICLSW
jgi:hypothetical protein